MLIPVILGFFLLRDILLLKIGPSAKIFPRLRIYAATQLISVALASAATHDLDSAHLLQFSTSPRIVFPIMMFYAGLAALCFWVRRTDRHHRAWLMAAVPNPVLVLGVMVVARFATAGWLHNSAIFAPSLLACLWIGVVGFALRGSDERRDVSELDYSLGVAALVNSIALVALPAEFLLASTNDWSGFLQFVGVLLSAD
jgi:hypothetical protein